MSKVDVSIIIPCFQQGRFLCECIKSLQSQTLSNWEAFIVNDGSSDETEEVSVKFSKHDSRIHYIKKENKGVSSARNVGLSFAVGEYIQFLDPDDKLEINKISHQVNLLNGNRHLDAVYGNAWYFTDQKPEILRRTFQESESSYDWILESAADKRSLSRKILEKNIFPICAPIFRKSFLDRIGKFDESLSHHEDWEYFLRAAVGGLRAAYSSGNNSDALIRTHPLSLSQNRTAMAESMLLIRCKIQDSLENTSERRINLINMMGLLSALAPENINDSKAQIYSVCTLQRDRLLFFFLAFFSRGGPLYFLICNLVPLLPLSILRILGISRSSAQSVKSYLNN
jgi:glycosyltransferase involved in cell wall biosynthesis